MKLPKTLTIHFVSLTSLVGTALALPPGSKKFDPAQLFTVNTTLGITSCAMVGGSWKPGRVVGTKGDHFYPVKIELKNTKASIAKASGSQRKKLERKRDKLKKLLNATKELCLQGPSLPPPPNNPHVSVLKELDRPLTLADINHLYRRAGLGPPPSEARQFVGRTAKELVKHFMTPLNDSFAEMQATLWLDGDIAPPHYPANMPNRGGLQLYTLKLLLRTPNHFHERLALLALHDRLATSTVPLSSAQLYLMINHLELLRMRGGREMDYPTLIAEMGEDPVMIKWLSLDQNVVDGPNENYARELMELFTLDPLDSKGEANYSDDDVKEVARAFTGWKLVQDGSAWLAAWFPAKADPHNKFIFAQKSYATTIPAGKDGGRQVVSHIFNYHPNAALSLANWITREYLRADAASNVTEELAEILRQDSFNMRRAFEVLLSSAEFYKPENRYAILKRPVERAIYLLRVMDSVGMPYDFNRYVRAPLANIGCLVTVPETVFGCDTEDIIDAQRLITSVNMSMTLSRDDTSFGAAGWTYARFFPKLNPTSAELISHFEKLFAVEFTEMQRSRMSVYLNSKMVNGVFSEEAWNPNDSAMVRRKASGLLRIVTALPQVHDHR